MGLLPFLAVAGQLAEAFFEGAALLAGGFDARLDLAVLLDGCEGVFEIGGYRALVDLLKTLLDDGSIIFLRIGSSTLELSLSCIVKSADAAAVEEGHGLAQRQDQTPVIVDLHILESHRQVELQLEL